MAEPENFKGGGGGERERERGGRGGGLAALKLTYRNEKNKREEKHQVKMLVRGFEPAFHAFFPLFL